VITGHVSLAAAGVLGVGRAGAGAGAGTGGPGRERGIAIETVIKTVENDRETGAEGAVSRETVRGDTSSYSGLHG
jgi:hypothetical protein